MVSLAVIHQLQQSQTFQLDMLRLKREQEAEERKHIADDLRSHPSCCLCGAEMPANAKNAACGACRR